MKRSIFPVICAVFALFSHGALARDGGHWHGGPHVGLGVWVGPPVVVGPPFAYPYPYYTYGYAVPYPYYGGPIVREYSDRDREEAAPIDPPKANWYYCPEERAYYPYVKACPKGWEAVPAQPRNTPR